MNEKQIDIMERVLINSANVTLATLILGGFLSSRGFELTNFSAGIMIFIAFVGWAMWLRKK